MTVAKAAEHLSITKQRIYALIREGKLVPRVVQVKEYRITAADVAEMARKRAERSARAGA